MAREKTFDYFGIEVTQEIGDDWLGAMILRDYNCEDNLTPELFGITADDWYDLGQKLQRELSGDILQMALKVEMRDSAEASWALKNRKLLWDVFASTADSRIVEATLKHRGQSKIISSMVWFVKTVATLHRIIAFGEKQRESWMRIDAKTRAEITDGRFANQEQTP